MSDQCDAQLSPALIRQGAEAKLYRFNFYGRDCIIKERFVKHYRHPDLDARLTLERTRAEARILTKCRALGIRTPTIYHIDRYRSAIYMEYLNNTFTIKELINKMLLVENDIIRFTLEEKLSDKIGSAIGTLHKHDIIHGDLTSSNILVTIDSVILEFHEGDSIKLTPERADLWSPELIFIDFGLAFISSKAEDKGVDLYVLERALLSSHRQASKINQRIIESYCIFNEKQSKSVIAKLDDVRSRGRKREMIG